MLASYHGHAPLVRLLLQHGADPNTLNDRGQSPLAGAVFKGEKEVVEVCFQSLLSLWKSRVDDITGVT
jgi:ankyrin repeat protein